MPGGLIAKGGLICQLIRYSDRDCRISPYLKCLTRPVNSSLVSSVHILSRIYPLPHQGTSYRPGLSSATRYAQLGSDPDYAVASF